MRTCCYTEIRCYTQTYNTILKVPEQSIIIPLEAQDLVGTSNSLPLPLVDERAALERLESQDPPPVNMGDVLKRRTTDEL